MHGGKSGRREVDPFADAEVPGAENLSALNASMKHEEDVQAHIENGNLAPHEIAIYIMDHGSTGQKISLLQHLGRTLKVCDSRAVAQVLTSVVEHIWNEDMELQICAPQALQDVLPALAESHIIQLFQGARTMLEVRTEQVRSEWGTLLIDMVTYLQTPTLINEIIPLALKKGEHNESQDQRILSCRLFGKLCSKLDTNTIATTVLDKAMSLCQDTEVGVRVAMCNHLAEIARAIGLKLTKERITTELFELLVDEEKLVSRAAFSTLIDLIEFFDAPYRREHVYPIIKGYISSPPEEVLYLLIEEFGRFLTKIKSDIQAQEDIALFANFFRQSAQKPDPEVRRMCAFNLPAVVASLPSSVYATHLNVTTKTLAVDSHAPTRRAIAAGLHELCRLLGDKAAGFLKDAFLALLQDSSTDVKTVLVIHLDVILSTFHSQLKGDDREMFFMQIAIPLVAYETVITKDWRKVNQLFGNFRCLVNFFPSQTIYEKFVPILTHHLTNGVSATKDIAASLLVLFTRSLTNLSQVVEIFAKLGSDFAHSECCFMRATYILISHYVIICYSRRFVRERIFDLIIELTKDQVSNVRRRVALLLPDIKRTLKPPVEPDVNSAFQNAVQRLLSDADVDVREAMMSAKSDLEEIDKDFSRQSALRITESLADQEDKKKDQEEGNLVDMAKEHEKLERRQKLKEMLKNDSLHADPPERPARGKATPKRSGSHSLSPHKTGSGTRLPPVKPAGSKLVGRK